MKYIIAVILALACFMFIAEIRYVTATNRVRKQIIGGNLDALVSVYDYRGNRRPCKILEYYPINNILLVEYEDGSTEKTYLKNIYP